MSDIVSPVFSFADRKPLGATHTRWDILSDHRTAKLYAINQDTARFVLPSRRSMNVLLRRLSVVDVDLSEIPVSTEDSLLYL